MILFLAIASTLLALCWSVLVIMANGMSDASGPTQGAGSVAVLWLFSVAVWLWWFAS